MRIVGELQGLLLQAAEMQQQFDKLNSKAATI
jgi:hypothetical protein